MAIARVQNAGAVSNSVAFGSSNTGGNLLVACIQSSAAVSTPTDTASNTWVQAVAMDVTGDQMYNQIWYVKNCVGGANTVSFSNGFGASFCHIWVGEYSGIDTTSPLDQTVAAQGSGAGHSAYDSGATSTTSQADELLVGCAITASALNATWTQPNTEQYDDNSAGASRSMTVADQIVSATGTYKTSGTFSGTTVNEPLTIATFKAAAGGGGGGVFDQTYFYRFVGGM